MALENMENPKLSMQLFSILCNHNFLQKIGFVKNFDEEVGYFHQGIGN